MGYKVRMCEVCKKRRRMTFVSAAYIGKMHIIERWVCSQGHFDNIERGTMALMNHLLKSVYLDAMKEWFSQPNILMGRLHR